MAKNQSNENNSSVVMLHLNGRGVDAIRMEKRLYCAARALGIKVQVDWISGNYASPVVYLNNQVLVDHLVDTPAIETILRDSLNLARISR